jgi:hypothetical protein
MHEFLECRLAGIEILELASFLEVAGFDEVNVATERETSSRRPDEAAYFLYATCRSVP